jgi:ABC-type methionine transport system ATPase subunit
LVKLRVKLEYPEGLVTEPIVAQLVTLFNIIPNIRGAHVSNSSGWLICELDGDPENVESAVGWLQSKGIVVSVLGGDAQ